MDRKEAEFEALRRWGANGRVRYSRKFGVYEVGIEGYPPHFVAKGQSTRAWEFAFIDAIQREQRAKGQAPDA